MGAGVAESAVAVEIAVEVVVQVSVATGTGTETDNGTDPVAMSVGIRAVNGVVVVAGVTRTTVMIERTITI